MANYDVVVDVGSKYVSAALKEDGYMIKLPAAVAFDGADGKVVAVGVEAMTFAAKNGGARLSYPILDGSVIDSEGAKALFSGLLNRILPSKANIFNKISVTCVVPCGANSNDKRTLETLFLSIGARQVTFVEAPLAESVSLFKQFRTKQGVVVDIGYDCADLAVVYSDNIVTGCTVYHAGKHLTQAIAERVRTKYMLELSDEQAERLKLNCASLYSNDISVCSVYGVNTETGNTENVSISSKELYDTVADFVKKYRRVIDGLLTSAPERIAAVVRDQGVLLCGGGALLQGIDSFLSSALKMPVRIADDPENTAITGALDM